MFKKQKGEREEDINESWLLPYSDLMTLLLALFIVLFAVSRVDTEKLQAMSQAFNNVFSGGAGVFDKTSDDLKIFDGSDDPVPDVKPSTTPRPTEEAEQDEEAEAEKEKQEQIDALKQSMEEFFAENGMSEYFNVENEANTLVITLDSDILFASGSAELNVKEKNIARQLSDMIHVTQNKGYPLRVQVYGHTDNVAIGSSLKYASNWELSLDRAASFMIAMIEGSKLDPRAFSAIGCGELQPIATNDTPRGRSKNRRVEIIIIY